VWISGFSGLLVFWCFDGGFVRILWVLCVCDLCCFRDFVVVCVGVVFCGFACECLGFWWLGVFW